MMDQQGSVLLQVLLPAEVHKALLLAADRLAIDLPGLIYWLLERYMKQDTECSPTSTDTASCGQPARLEAPDDCKPPEPKQPAFIIPDMTPATDAELNHSVKTELASGLVSPSPVLDDVWAPSPQPIICLHRADSLLRDKAWSRDVGEEMITGASGSDIIITGLRDTGANKQQSADVSATSQQSDDVSETNQRSAGVSAAHQQSGQRAARPVSSRDQTSGQNDTISCSTQSKQSSSVGVIQKRKLKTSVSASRSDPSGQRRGGLKEHLCSFCGTTWSSRSRLIRHLQSHTGEKPYVCDQCGSRFTSVSHLNAHIANHADRTPHKCDLCDARFTQLSSLKDHIRTHTGEKPYKCEQCGAQFTKRWNLKMHCRSHTGEAPHKCGWCGVAFAKKCALEAHQRRHSGDRPYVCSVCQASFTKAITLKVHSRIHSGERPYKCEHCGAGYIQRGSLRSHMYKHTGERPFQCDTCSADFTSKAGLKYHQRTHVSTEKRAIV